MKDLLMAEIEKTDLNCSLDTKMVKKLGRHTSRSQKWISILIVSKKLMHVLWDQNDWTVRKFNGVWNNVSNIIEKAFNTQLGFEEKYLKIKINYYNSKSNTRFFNKKVPRENVNCLYIVVMVLDSACKI